ncbi:eukaryotic translation initiation factor 4G [Argentina anserina]|uniref:eukaryotic translation initiation factor 4G n=1 Tax=Argentina anserina TaxID=57926 RepID=UPI0021766D70|nr:eukaryotic translation initiation factor 4G [Potentilla anserina]
MSFNQSRSDKNETQYRKTGRSASSNQQHRGYSPAFPKGSGAPGPAPSISSQRSFKKTNTNAQGGQSRGNVAPLNPLDPGTASTPRGGVPNGGHVQPQHHGASETSFANTAPKQTEPSVAQRGPRAVPKAPAPQPASMNTDSRGPHTPVKSPGDASKGFSFQFGSISPGLMNGMQIPARTSSAPPNLDEQKRDQARHESFRPVPSMPTPSVPKQQPPRKDQHSVDQSSAAEAHLQPKPKKDVQVAPTPPASQTQKPSGPPMPGISMAIPFHQPQVSLQFGGPNQQIQSKGMPPNSLQMPMPIQLPTIGSSQVQQPVFVPGLQPHPMQPPNIMHQGQNLGFTPQMGPQLGNLGIGIGPQYPQQQGGKFAGPRKTPVKITHPDTHEELRLDKRADSYPDGGSSAARTHHNVSQSQPMPSFAGSHPTSYYTNSYNPNALFFPSPNSHPLSSNHMPSNSQAPRFSYPVSQVPPQSMPFMNLSAHTPNLEHARDVHNKIASVSSTAIPVTVKPAIDSFPNSTAAVERNEFSKPSRPAGEVISSHPQRISGSDPAVNKSLPIVAKISANLPAAPSVEIQVSSSLSSTSVAPAEESVPVVSATEAKKKDSLSRSNSIKDQQKKQGKKGNIQPQHQLSGHSSTAASITSQEQAVSSSIGVSEPVPVPESTESVSELARESSSNVSSATTDVSDSKAEAVGEGTISTSEVFGASQIGNSSLLVEQGEQELVGAEKQSEESLPEGYKQEASSLSISSESASVKSLESVNKEAELSVAKETTEGSVIGTSETAGVKVQHVRCNSELDTINNSSSRSDSMGNIEVASAKPSSPDQPSAPFQSTEISGTTSKHEGESLDNAGGDSLTVSGSKDKPLPELSRTKSTVSKPKKKLKDILSKADAAGVTSDLYGAYKNPEDKKDVASSESVENTPTGVSSKQEGADSTQQVAAVRDEGTQSIAEPDDWEDAADISTPKLENSGGGELPHGDIDGSGYGEKKYSRDFLLKFSMQFRDVPEGFEITSDILEVLDADANTSASVDYDSIPSPGRIVDRPGGAGRARGSGMIEDDRWNKGGNANFRPVQGGVSYGVLRSPGPRGQPQHVRGILPGPIPGSGMQRNNPDADRWQRATNFQPKGSMSSPQTPLQVMHKAERKYEVGKVSDEEQAKQRQLKAILNKLTPQNFEKLFDQVKAVNIDNARTLSGVISQIFDKALMEPTFCEMYANFCYYLAAELPDFSEDNEKITFKRLLLNKCQEEFETGEREQQEAEKADEEGEVKQSEAEREEKRIKARRRMLGNIRLIGELYKKKMLTERIMHDECIKKLLGQQQTPDEEDIESLCKLMSTIGEMIDHPKAKEHMDAYFERMKSLSNNMKLSSRVRFMLKDTIDLRKNRWQQRRKVEGPKKIEEVHRDAAQERQAQASRLSRGPGMNSSARRGAPMEFSPRGSPMLSPSNAQMGGFRGMPSPGRGFGSQDARTDVRVDEKHSYEGRTLSVPLTQRPMGDESITLGPQGGLARGMSVRGSPSMSAAAFPDLSSNPGDSRMMTAGLNGFSSHSERGTYNPREGPMSRIGPDRFGGPAYDQSAPERNLSFGSRDPRTSDRSFDRSLTAPPTRAQGAALVKNVSSEKSEEYLRDKSLGAIKEFYSARDEKEVALCIKDLNSPDFHPTMISLWVTDSFERKDGERDLFAKLLISLTKSQDGTLSQSQLIEGFDSTLSTLEDAVNDAPRAPEFLARIFAKVILENVVSLNQIGQSILKGGEEPGSLLEGGLAGNVLGYILEIIKSEKGESVLKEIRTSSNLRLENFRPPDPLKSRMLEKFL